MLRAAHHRSLDSRREQTKQLGTAIIDAGCPLSLPPSSPTPRKKQKRTSAAKRRSLRARA